MVDLRLNCGDGTIQNVNLGGSHFMDDLFFPFFADLHRVW